MPLGRPLLFFVFRSFQRFRKVRGGDLGYFRNVFEYRDVFFAVPSRLSKRQSLARTSYRQCLGVLHILNSARRDNFLRSAALDSSKQPLVRNINKLLLAFLDPFPVVLRHASQVLVDCLSVAQFLPELVDHEEVAAVIQFEQKVVD